MFTQFRPSESGPLKKYLQLILVSAVLLLALPAIPQSPQAESQRYINDIKALTTPALEGWGDGTKGLTLAAHLIEHRFKRLGLQPAGMHGYFQPFMVTTGARLRGVNRFQIQAGNTSRELKLHDDFR